MKKDKMFIKKNFEPMNKEQIKKRKKDFLEKKKEKRRKKGNWNKEKKTDHIIKAAIKKKDELQDKEKSKTS